MKATPGFREIAQRARQDGLTDATRRLVRRLSTRIDVGALDFPLLDSDIADSTRLVRSPSEPVPQGSALTIAWVCTPPSPGSGGHTTLFRMVEAAERAGHRCVVFLYDRHGGDHERHRRVLRRFWPGVSAEVRDATLGIGGADAYVATSWESAHVIASRVRTATAMLYFIQDFEPYFHAKGTLYALAEDSYRFGFVNIALGELVACELADRGIDHAVVPFGCDTDVYRLDNPDRERSGVVYYTKPGSDRRGYLLGRLALEEFHRRHPEEPIHIYGDAVDDWRIPVVQHGRLSPSALNELYNSSKAGLAISFTNITLVAEEMLAAGAIPVVTEAPYARNVLPNPDVQWAATTPGALADGLGRAVGRGLSAAERTTMAHRVTRGWGATSRETVRLIEQAAWAPRNEDSRTRT
ncbi:glycosyltransferase family 1 protein [Cryobacterium adonitolivorans]|uniref:Glycosyltransferase family 1 protein n=1 Tax=Cryobacterium adonitolivorans TaxID=1259189 RepID=A0A4R8WGP9_9MICO|nr:glycosyltransferase family 1 protein [Cryobacterium adonitolivorans]TFC07180.1 glycosyltransferase family 1 protein [Cryobacterium adonitolivorans]